jgi:uncharacterized phage-associated protein
MAGYSAIDVANAFFELAKKDGVPLTNMQLQKLVYIAHGWSLALYDTGLFEEEVQAWEWGPVIPKLYNKLKKYGAGFVTEPIPNAESSYDGGLSELALIKRVWAAYGKFSGPKLSAITHIDGTPWSQVWHSRPYEEISPELIRQHYRKLLNERRAAQTTAAK